VSRRSSKACVRLAAVALAISLAGCPGDPKTVDRAVDETAFTSGTGFMGAVRSSDWTAACAMLTLEARIELQARMRRQDGLRSQPSCVRALSGRSFQALCGAFWGRARSALNLYRETDVGKRDSTPNVAWTAVARGRKPISRCELRLTRKDSEHDDWLIDAIALRRSEAVVYADRYSLVNRAGRPIATP